MPKEFQLYVFEFEGIAETNRQHEFTEVSQTPIQNDSGFVTTLNEHSAQIALDIEKEITRFFRSSATVQAEVRFYEGSIIIEGTILIMSWLGPIALAAGKKAFEAEFSRVVEVATQRVLQRAMRQWVPSAKPARKIEVRSQDTETEPEPEKLSGVQSYLSGNLPTFVTVNTILLLILLVFQMTALLLRVMP